MDGPRNDAPEDLEEWFRRRGLKEVEQIEKATSFLTEAARYAEMDVAVRGSRADQGPPVHAREAVRTGTVIQPAEREVQSSTPAPLDDTLAAKWSAYVDLLMALVVAGRGQPVDPLLDRLERLLGYPPAGGPGRRSP